MQRVQRGDLIGQCNIVQDQAETITKADVDTVKVDPWTHCLERIRDERCAESFAALFGHFAPRAKAFLMRGGSSEALAEEAAQEALATVWQKAAKFDGSRASASTWIFTILRNKQIDAIRKARRPEPEDLPWGMEPQADAADSLAMSQEETVLREAVRTLPDAQRDIIERAYFGDLTHAQIAVVTGLPLGTIKSRIRLGLDRLRHEMTKHTT